MSADRKKDRPRAVTNAPTEAEIIRFLTNEQRRMLEQSNGDATGDDSDQSARLVLYEDEEFSPAALTTLYLDPTKLPEYATSDSSSAEYCDESTAHSDNGVGGVFWYRPTEYADDPDYFKSTSGCGTIREGQLPDAWLLGVFAALAEHPDNLIENLFVSDSLHAFKDYGVFTCRFYKNGAWVTVTTDTRVPYALELDADDQCPSLGNSTPGSVRYGSSVNKNEVFMPFLEKAYAKLHGSYQALAETPAGSSSGGGASTGSKILEAFLDCTGGSAHRIDLLDERLRRTGDDTSDSSTNNATAAVSSLWKRLVRYKRKKCIVTAQLKQLSFHAIDVTASGIVKNRQYIVQHVKEVSVANAAGSAGGSGASTTAAPASTLRFVKLKTVWGHGMWKGDWSNDDSKWEEHMQVENAMRSDAACAFSRSGTDGCFWMIYDDVLDTFTELFVVHVLDDAMYQYCVQSEWLGHSAGGAATRLTSSTDSDHTRTHKAEQLIARTKWSVLPDAEANWHRNPQFKLTVTERTPSVLLSLAQRDFRLFGGDNYAINFVVLKHKATRSSVVWELVKAQIVAEAHSYETNESGSIGGSSSSSSSNNTATTPATPGGGGGGSQQPKQLPEREVVKEELVLEPDVAYVVVPYTDNARVDMEFFLRVFAPKPVLVERLAPLFSCVAQGKWRNDDDESGDPTNAGGPLCLQLHGGDENPAWCQNPQFWLRLKPMRKARLAALLAARPHVTIKVVVRKTSHKASNAAKARQREASKEKCNLVGVTAVRTMNTGVSAADATAGAKAANHSTASVLRAHAKAPKTNFLGEVVEKPFAKATRGAKATKSIGSNSDAKRSGNDTFTDDEDDDNDDELHADAKQSDAAAVVYPPPKLVVKPDEWCRISEYSSPATGCLYLRKVPKEWLLSDRGGGLLLVPSLGEAGAEGTFELQVDSDFPLVLDELPKFVTQSLPGEWTDATAAGCHLHSNWKKNPKLFLRLKGVRPARVTITLTRSELEWRPKCKRDAVGTMIGFYVFPNQKLVRDSNAPSPNIVVNGRPWTETDFVPLHAVQSPPELVLPAAFNEPYVIMPATYEPHKLGTFVVSVQCDVEFSLSHDPE